MLTLEAIKERVTYLDFRTEKASFGRYGIHDYPAMLHYLVVREIIKEFGFDRKTLYDPFCGSGVSLCEGLRAGLCVYGTDINPLALLIAKVRCSNYSEIFVDEIIQKVKLSTSDIPVVKNINYWFKDYVIEELGKIRATIKTYRDANFYELLLVAFSQTIRNVSNNRKGEFKRFRLSEKELSKFNPNVLDIFQKTLVDYLNRLRKDFIRHNNSINIFRADTRERIPFKEEIDLVITSPPYGDSKTTVAYGQFSSFSLDWLQGLNPFGDADLSLDNKSLGGKKTNNRLNFSETLKSVIEALTLIDIKRAQEVQSFYSDLFLACRNIVERLSKKAIVCFVVGNRSVKGIQIPMDDIVKEIFESLGLRHIKTLIREIHNKRMPLLNSPSNKTGEKSTTMKYEYIILMEKA